MPDCSITARSVASIGDENAGCAPAFLQRNGAVPEEALLGVVDPGAIAAATAAAKEAEERQHQVRDVLSRDLEAARAISGGNGP